MFSIGAFAMIFDEIGRVLLCHRRDMDVWNLPGGGVERGELPTEAAIRETKNNLPSNIPPKQVERIHDAVGSSVPPIFRRQSAPSTQEMLLKKRYDKKLSSKD